MENIENIITVLVAIIILGSTVLSNLRRRKAQHQNTGSETADNAVPGGENAPPPFMENFPFDTQMGETILQIDEKEPMQDAEEPATPESQGQPEPPPVPVESPYRTRSVPATSLLELSPQTFRQGIILSEILGRPKRRSVRRASRISNP